MVCASCAERLQREGPKDSHTAFTRGLLFGIGGALLGLILYAGFEIITGWIIGYVALAVGYIVAKAIMLGSRGIGGRRYQIAAVILTYAAVSMAAIPVSIAYLMNHKNASTQAESMKHASSDSQSSAGQQQEQPPGSRMGLGEALLQLALLGLASPFLELQGGFGGLIGLVILFVGIRIAWKITQGKSVPVVDGPFQNASAP